MFIARVGFWFIVISAVSLMFSGLQAAYPPNIKTDEQIRCNKIGGAYNYKVSKDFYIPCLTQDHAIFYDKNNLVTYMLNYYKEQFTQDPAIFIKD